MYGRRQPFRASLTDLRGLSVRRCLDAPRYPPWGSTRGAPSRGHGAWRRSMHTCSHRDAPATAYGGASLAAGGCAAPTWLGVEYACTQRSVAHAARDPGTPAERDMSGG